MADAGREAPMEAKAAVASSVRVVRCPRCGKYLPELEDFKFYRCGGCGAILKAKRSIQEKAVSSEKSDGVNLMVSSEKSDGVNSVVSSEKSDGEILVMYEDVGTPSSKKEMPPDGSPRTVPGSSRGNAKENEEASPERTRKSNGSPSCMLDLNGDIMFKDSNTSKHDYLKEESPTSHGENSYQHPSKTPVHNSDSNLDEISKIYSPMNSRENKNQRVQMVEETVLQGDNEDGVSRSQKGTRASSQGMQFSGTSNSQPISIHSQEYTMQELHDRAKNFKDPAELLKTLDLIRDHLIRPYEVQDTDSETERAPRNKIEIPTRPYPCHFSEGRSSINSSSDHHFLSVNENGLESQNYHSKLHPQDGIFGHRGPSGPWALRQRSCHNSDHYLQRPYLNHAFEQVDPSLAMPHSHEAFYRQPTSACQHCHNNHWQMPSHDLSSGSKNRTGSFGVDAVGNPMFPQTGSYNSTTIKSSLLSQQPLYPQRSAPQNRCGPFAGGAPFIVCQYCFNLLQVPPTILSNGKERKKLQCGSCFKVISFQIAGKKLVSSTTPMGTDASSEPSNTANGILGSPKSDVEVDCVHSDSQFENSGSAVYDPPSVDERIPALSSQHRPPPNWVMTNELYLHSSESVHMETEGELPHSSDAEASKKEVAKSSELAKSSEINACIPTFPTSGPYSPSSDHSVSNPEMSTEMNLQVNGHTNWDLPQDSIKMNKEGKLGKTGDSFISGLIRKSIRGSNQLLGKEKINVSVNGYSIPSHLVKKAEKRAGLIQPGDYWYDYHAGFWGVMGEPCMGIIPPFIEEFNYAMPKKCAGGNTAVLVNGRELNRKDLQLLVDRGLAKSSGRSYRIDISGRVTDAISGEELDGLGKLAPTIEKLKKGFGMRHP